MGQAIFYNMTSMSLNLQVNGTLNAPETVAAMPSTPYYTPNHSVGPYKRWNTGEPQPNQFGTTNTVAYTLDGGAGGQVTVTVDVNFTAYSEPDDLLFFLYKEAAVATCLSDNNAYLGHNGDIIDMDPNNPAAKRL